MALTLSPAVTSPRPEILLVEDSRHEAELTFRALDAKKPRIEYLHLRDGQQALDYLLRRGEHAGQAYGLPQLVLLDLDLPRVSGQQVLQTLKSDPSTKQIPVVIITMSDSEAQMRAAYQLGANSYIVKSMDFYKYSLCIAEVVQYWLVTNDLPGYAKPSTNPYLADGWL